MELTDPVLKIIERVIEKLRRQQSDIDAIQFCFMPGFETTNTIIFDTATGDIFRWISN